MMSNQCSVEIVLVNSALQHGRARNEMPRGASVLRVCLSVPLSYHDVGGQSFGVSGCELND